jgi:TPR repeat protein
MRLILILRIVAVFTLFSFILPQQSYALRCLPRYALDSDACQYVQYTERKAKEGIRLSQFALGEMYADGDYILPNHKLAIEWLEKAGKEGSGFEYFILGYHHQYGRNFPQDKQKALKWYRKAKVRKRTPCWR